MTDRNTDNSKRECFYSHGKKWHYFNHEGKPTDKLIEGNICVCGEMKVINGVVSFFAGKDTVC